MPIFHRYLSCRSLYYPSFFRDIQWQHLNLHWKASSKDTPSVSRFSNSRGESTETMKARLLYQSRKRGILEADLLLSTFAEKYLPLFTRQELETYDKVLSLYILGPL
ncbi:hypothetical protein MERGE_001430 [Pneumocystis wakefieldiae]|uniref:Succinate dehydrogenase assembly factor 2, mitochondrial n=1 Tax=Pneumocystis wakefieldiae TaxID=38082 RepID=A0A899G2Q6_9ASCO|nr:hypothetical protein MERGE_001430 [Pneumocystis wakefieldiae]